MKKQATERPPTTIIRFWQKIVWETKFFDKFSIAAAAPEFKLSKSIQLKNLKFKK